MFDATDGGPAVAEMAGITGGSFVLNGVTWHHENDVTKLQGQLGEERSRLEKIADHIEFKGEDFADLPTAVWAWGGECNRAGQSLAARHAADDIAYANRIADAAKAELAAIAADVPGDGTLQARDNHFHGLGFLDGHRAASELPPSFPDVKSSEALRFAADVNAAHGYILDAHDLRVIADRLEREQAAKTSREQLVDQVQAQLIDALELTPIASYPPTRPIARALVDHFDITPKSADAGLLKAGEQ